MAYNAENALDFAQKQRGKAYGNGQCWTLMEAAVTKNGGKSSKELTPQFSKVSSYVWGSTVRLEALWPGDVLQFSGYEWTRKIDKKIVRVVVSETTIDEETGETKTTQEDGGSETDLIEEVYARGEPQHSAMVVEVLGPGSVKIIEQNIKEGSNKKGVTQIVELVLADRPPQTTKSSTPGKPETSKNDKGQSVKKTIIETVTITITDKVKNLPNPYRPIGEEKPE